MRKLRESRDADAQKEPNRPVAKTLVVDEFTSGESDLSKNEERKEALNSKNG